MDKPIENVAKKTLADAAKTTQDLENAEAEVTGSIKSAQAGAAKAVHDVHKLDEKVQGTINSAKSVISAINTALGVPSGSEGARWHDHQGGFRFELEFGSLKAGGFRSVDGLGVSVELIEYQSGTDKYPRQIPGRPKIAPVVLKKGYVNTAVLWNWMKATMDGKFKFENVSVVLMDDSGQEELARYDLLDTWPSRWSGWQLDANGSNAMVEELELQVRHIKRVGGKKA